jgi:hypothetical protein
MALTIANPLLLHYPATSSNHSFFYCFVPFEVSRASTVTAWGETRHTAPSLRLFHPEQPNSVSPFLSSLGCACNVTFLWLSSFRDDHSPTTTSAPFLDQLVPSCSLISFQSVRFIAIIQSLHIHYFSQHNHSKITSSISHGWGR